MKRSTNKENLLKQLKDVNNKILKLQVQKAGIEKSLKKLQNTVDQPTRTTKMDL